MNSKWSEKHLQNSVCDVRVYPVFVHRFASAHFTSWTWLMEYQILQVGVFIQICCVHGMYFSGRFCIFELWFAIIFVQISDGIHFTNFNNPLISLTECRPLLHFKFKLNFCNSISSVVFERYIDINIVWYEYKSIKCILNAPTHYSTIVRHIVPSMAIIFPIIALSFH